MDINSNIYIRRNNEILMDREALKRIGLAEEEINIYFILLRRGFSKATVISKELNVARTTTYRFLNSLLEKGLISENIQNNVKYFYPVDPKRIPEILEERTHEIEKIIPELVSMQGISNEESKVELFKGKEGMKTVMRDIIREGKSYTFIGEAEKYFSDVSIFITQWLKSVEEKKIIGKLLCSKTQKFKVAKTETYKLLDEDLIPEISIWTYGNKTALVIWSNPSYAIIIDSKAVTNGNRKTFDYLWRLAKNPSKEHFKETNL